MGIESYKHRTEIASQPLETDIKISEKSRRLSALLNTMTRIIVSGSILFGAWTLSTELGASIKKRQERKEIVTQTGETGGKLFDRFGTNWRDDLYWRGERQRIPNTESQEPVYIEPLSGSDGVIKGYILKEIISTTYPRGWFENNISAIRVSDLKPLSIRRDAPNLKPLAINMGKENKKKSSITFDHKRSQEFSKKYLVEHALAHEGCHSFEYNLSASEATKLFEAIVQRLEASDRFQSEYVENIEVADQKTTAFMKAQEYWAEICAQFFKDPTQLHIEDFRIVSGQVAKVDPTFNWKTASKKRKDLIYEKVKDQKKSYAKKRSKHHS